MCNDTRVRHIQLFHVFFPIRFLFVVYIIYTAKEHNETDGFP